MNIFFELLIGIPLGLVGVYYVARLATAAYFYSKQQYLKNTREDGK